MFERNELLLHDKMNRELRTARGAGPGVYKGFVEGQREQWATPVEARCETAISAFRVLSLSGSGILRHYNEDDSALLLSSDAYTYAANAWVQGWPIGLHKIVRLEATGTIVVGDEFGPVDGTGVLTSSGKGFVALTAGEDTTCEFIRVGPLLGKGLGRLPVICTNNSEVTTDDAEISCTVVTAKTHLSAYDFAEFTGTAFVAKEILGLGGGTIDAGTLCVALYFGPSVYGEDKSYGIVQVACG